MKIENQDGKQVIILEKNDEIKIKKSDSNDSITLQMDKNKINISGSSDIIGTIKGRGMLDKVYVPPVISSTDIIAKCDKWLDIYKKVHDEFKKSVLETNFRENQVCMELILGNYFSLDDFTIKGKTIDLNLKQYNTTVQEGVTISIPDDNEDVYAYLIANVLDYYVEQNHKGKKINNMTMNFNGILYSNIEKEDKSCVPMLASISTIMESQYLSRVVNSVLSAHDLGLSTNQIIDNLRNRIDNQQIEDNLDFGISYSERQYQHILLSKEESSRTRK